MIEATKRDLRSEIAFAKVATVISSVILVAAIGVLAYQCVLWQRTGYWPSMPLRDYAPQMFLMATFDWKPLEGVYFAALNFDIGLVSFIVGAILFILSMRSWSSCTEKLEALTLLKRRT